MRAANWSDGYVTDIDYEYFYFHELAPAHMDYVCLQMGHRPPAMDRPFNYCELGCGMGLTTLGNAATNPTGQFFGVDINPNHVLSARRLAEEGQVENVTFLEASFEDLPGEDLPRFDYITLHGVWTWISPDVREQILAFIRSNLATGGAVYISYNGAIGWERRQTLGRLFKQLVRSAPGHLEQRVEAALAVMSELIEQGEGYFADNEVAKGWLEAVRGASVRYLAHEYLNDHWTLFYHADVARHLAEAKLSFAGSADVLRNFDRYVLKEKSNEIAQRVADPRFTEMLKDLDTNWGLRRDVYLRGTTHWTQQEAYELFGRQRVALVAERSKVETDTKTPIGESSIDPKLLNPVADALAERSHSLGELLDLVEGFSFFDVLVVSAVLIQNGLAVPAPMRDTADATATSQHLNRVIGRRTLRGESIPVLVSPVAGQGILFGDLERCCYHYMAGDEELDAPAMAKAVTADLAAIGRTPLHEGKETSEEQFVEFIQSMIDEKLPVWKMLGML